jgi:predicted ribosomally synthesized peptide with SipW-like signal peptide
MVLSALVVLGSAAAIAAGATGAFFSDTETSTGNIFTAGAIDLKIDNESYYNGNKCVNVSTDPQAPNWQWSGNAAYPVPGTSCSTSFPASDLNGHVFFAFDDVKPDDEGEDTISIHVNNNDAYACMDLTLTSNDDKSSNEPELGDGDTQNDVGNLWDGELAQNLQFFWWADDGDNVYEVGERALTKTGGVQSLYDLATSTGAFSIALADAANNAWGQPNGTPIPGGQTVYIAKAWCMGTLTLNPVTAGQGVNPSVASGVTCNGTQMNNITQTDGVELTVKFRAEQSRNNGRFLCNPPTQQFGTLTVNKALLVSSTGIEVGDFTLHIVGPNGDQIVTDEVPVPNLPVGSYTVYEQVTGNVGGNTFVTTFSGVCSTPGNVTTSNPFNLTANANVTCTILNDQVGDGIGAN